MKFRAVLVGSFFGKKLYYFLDPVGDKNSTGALVDENGEIEYLKFFSFIKSNPGIKEFRFSKFHRFLWDAPSQEQKAKWNRIFVNGTQRVDDEMLEGAKIITDFSPKAKQKQLFLDRALQFKSLNASQNVHLMPGSVLGRHSNPRRSRIGIKAIGRSIGNKPAIDGDADGFVDDGLPTMRPFIPGFDFILDAAGNVRESIPTPTEPKTRVQGGMSSGVVTRTQTLEDRLRPVSEEQIRTTMRKVRQYVEQTFNDGKPIATKRDALDVLARHIPSFASGESSIQFIDELTSDDELIPDWARNYLDSFLVSIDAQTDSREFNYIIKKARDSRSFEGAVSIRPGLSDFVRDAATGLLKPQRTRRSLVMFEYKESPSITPGSILVRGDKRARASLFNIGTAVVDSLRIDQISQKNISRQQLEDLDKLNAVDNQIKSISDALDQLISMNPDAPFSSAGNIKDLVNGTISNLTSTYPEPGFDANGTPTVVWKAIEPNIYFIDDKGRKSSFIEPSIARFWLAFVANPDSMTLQDLRDFIEQVKNSVEKTVRADNSMRKAQRKMETIDKEARILTSGLIALHESNHMLHNIQAAIDAVRAAEKIREELINDSLDNLRKNGVQLTDQVIEQVNSSIRIEDVYGELFVRRATELAEQDIELAKRRLMHSELFSGTALNPRILGDPKSKDPNNPDTYFGWHLSDSVNEAVKQMLLKFALYDSADPNSLSTKQQLAKNAIRAFLSQPTYDGTEKLTIGDGLARVFNELNQAYGGLTAAAFSADGRTFTAGDDLTLGMVAFLLNPDSISDVATSRNVFSGLRLRQYSALLEEVGFPDFEITDSDGNKTFIQGLNIDESQKLAAALLNMRSMAYDLPRDYSGNVPPNLSVQATTALRLRPDDIVLPFPFDDITKEELVKMPKDEFIRKYKVLLSNTLDAMADPMNMSQLGKLIESGVTQMNWWDKLDKDEIALMLKIIKNIGTPALKPGKSGTAYSPYMGFLTPPVYPGFATPPQFSEFFAEFAVAELFGIALSQIEVSVDSAGRQRATMRALTDAEANVILKFMRWMYPNGLLGEKLETVQ